MPLHTTPFHSFHIGRRAKMASFAGYDMPIQYSSIKEEHLHVRQRCGLFDVSHMGQFMLEGANAANILSYITPTNFMGFPVGKCAYTVLTNAHGGIEDDLIITRLSETQFYLVVNASRKVVDEAWILENIHNKNAQLSVIKDRALLAIQGPQAEKILQSYIDINLTNLKKMHAVQFEASIISRTGYTGEDGFEVSMPVDTALNLWHSLLEDVHVQPIGLGARDSLRLEAGFPLYGHDLTTETTPVEAAISWIISKEHKDFIGSDIILDQLSTKHVDMKRIGILLTGKGILREGYNILSEDGHHIGHITSGGYNPTDGKSIGQAYINEKDAVKGSTVLVEIRGKKISAELCGFRFI